MSGVALARLGNWLDVGNFPGAMYLAIDRGKVGT
jgi:hypothetical protein